MQRRNFLKNIALAYASLPMMSFKTESTFWRKRLIKPKVLKKGDTIGLITPGSFIDDEGLEKAIANVESLGFKVKLSTNIRKQRGYNAGTKQERVNDIHEMFADSEIDGIWAARGGYGCTGLLPLLDFKLIKRNPKVFIGYSDITVLHLAIHKMTGLVTFHGPVASSDFTEYTLKHLVDTITSPNIPPKIFPCEINDKNGETNDFFKPETLIEGETSGKLIGGNLSLISSMIGTPWEMEIDDKLLFIEDIGEAPYRIDKMLIQLDQNQDLKKAKGIAFSIFEDCVKPEDELSLSLSEMFHDNTDKLDIPSSYGFSFGHIANQFTLPLGIKAKMNAEERTIEFLEGAVV